MTANLKSDTSIPSVLQRIVATKHEEVVAARAAVSLETLKAQVAADTQPRCGFANALRSADIGIIAEIKKLHLLKVLSIITLRQRCLLSNMSKLVPVVCRCSPTVIISKVMTAT